MSISASEELKDNIESLIILALDANLDQASAKTTIRDRQRGGVMDIEDQGSLLGFHSLRPESAYTFDAAGGRIYACDSGLLANRPWEILGQRAEVMMLSHGSLKWYGLEKLRSIPRNVAVAGKIEACYAFHMRLITPSGLGEYQQRIVSFDKNGNPLPARIQGHWVCSPEKEGKTAVLCASLIEDAHRAGSMLATVTDATEIRFPVPIADYRQLFSDRTGPLHGSGKRKAILHWVSEHLRHSTTGKEHTVNRHARGIDEFVIDGLKIRIEENE
jgi:hypothetical protein